MNVLYLIPARGGSKGIPGKNIKFLAGKPLIYYSIDNARALTSDENICISTDDDFIISAVRSYGLDIPFKRPEQFATDTATTFEVIIHAIGYYEKLGKNYDTLILLQPTSPFRTANHIKEALELYNERIDMVVSVKETRSNPYYILYEEDNEGFLHKSKNATFTRRQDCPKVWELNGAIYIINLDSLRNHGSLAKFQRIKKFIMEEKYSIDLDTQIDWDIAEVFVEKGHIVL